MYPSIDNYTIIREIGAGGMATVYEAVDNRLKRTVALKILHAHLCNDTSAKERFKREAYATARLDHPNIVRIFDQITREDFHCIVMENVPGNNLDAILKSNQEIAPDNVVEIMWHVSCALAEAHRLGIMHRDIKPSNILIHHQGRAMLTDFGLAYQVFDSHLTIDNAIAGTPTYMSPEQISGKPLTFSSDVYSWGVTFYYLLSGKLPYRFQKFPEIVGEIQNGKITIDNNLLTMIPACYYEVIRRCLYVNPSQRIKDGIELKFEMERCRTGYDLHGDLRGIVNQENINRSDAKSQNDSPSKTAVFNAEPEQDHLSIFLTLLLIIAAPFISSLLPHRSSYHSDEFVYSARESVVVHKGSADFSKTGSVSVLFVGYKDKGTAGKTDNVRSAGKKRSSDSAMTDSGQLFIYCNPWATVYINGNETGTTPFAKPFTLMAGKYSIKLHNDHCVPIEDTVIVIARTILRKRYNMELIGQ